MKIVRAVGHTCGGAFLSLAMSTLGNAQLITYGAAQDISGDSNVINTGLNYDAIAFVGESGGGTSTGPTVNGVTFTDFGSDGGTSYTTGNFTVSSVGNYLHAYNGYAGSSTGLSSSYATLLDGGITNYGAQNGAPAGEYGDELTFSSLNVGDTYQLELFVNASSGKEFADQPTDDTTIVNSGATTTYAKLAAQGGSNNLGQYIIGNFTASSDTANIYLLSSGNDDALVLNAVVLNDTTSAPEPPTIAFAFAGVGCLVFFSRIHRHGIA